MAETLEQIMENVPSLEVIYPSGVKVERGNELTPTQVKDKPTTVSWPAEDDAFYTLLFLCPDAPSKADRKYADTWHWLVVNIPGSNVAEGHTVADYIGAAPGDDAGLNRYVYVVFKQQAKVESDQLQSQLPLEKRAKRNTREIAEKYKLGTPIAVSYFVAKFDDYVPQLRAQLPKLE